METDVTSKSTADNEAPPPQHTTSAAIRQMLQEFCETTSAHGLASVAHSAHVAVKCLWLVLFCAALAGISWQLSQLILTYSSYPTQEVTSTSNSPIHFPDVTICNIEPLDAEAAFALMRDQNSSTYEYGAIKVPEIRVLREKYPNISYLSAGRVESTKGYYENQTPEDRKASSHSLRDIVIGCTYAGQNCLENGDQHFKHKPDGTYVNCYIFSPGNISDTALGIGPDSGLSLILFTDTTNGSALAGTFDRFSNVKQAAGIRVTIHNRDTMPSPLIQGFDIMPGHSTAVGLSGVKLERLSLPYGNCSGDDWLTMLPEFSYSASACLLLSAQQHTFMRCGCLSVNLPIPTNLENETYCGYYDHDPDSYLRHLQCEPEAYLDFYSKVSDHGCCSWCHPSCNTYQFESVISESFWPNNRYHDSFYADIIESRPDRETLKAYSHIAHLKSGGTFYNTSIITDNFARLNVYFKSSEVLVRRQVASYDRSSLLSDMGGTVGLWAGLSLLTIIEVLSLLIRIILSCVRV